MLRLLAFALALGLATPALAAPVPKPQVFVVIARAPVRAERVKDAADRDLLVRADAAIVAAREAYDRATDRYMEALDAGAEVPPPEPVLDYSEARRLLDEALRAIGPRDAGRELALYLAGWLAAEELRDADAITHFGELTTRYPKSDLAEEAAFRTGDLHFDRGALDDARRAYRQAAASGRGRFYAIALYKLAWTAYRKDELDEAWQGFERLVVHLDGGVRDAQSESLRPEAIAYLAVILAQPDRDGEAWSRVTARLDGSQLHHPEVASRLAELLREQGDEALAAQVESLAETLTAPAPAPKER